MMTSKDLMRQSERGSAHVWVVSVLVLIIIALLGVVLWQQLSKSDDDKSKNETSKVDSSTSTDDSTPESTVSTYTSNDAGMYVKSFDYPSNWRVVKNDEMCKVFEACMSPPVLMLADKDNSAKMWLNTPQSASTTSIDTYASEQARDGGEVVSNFKDLDGLSARKIKTADGEMVIVVSLRGGFGAITFGKTVDASEMDTILSTWKW